MQSPLPLWIIVAGGVSLILFGARYLRKGLDQLFGPRLGPWIQRLTDNRIRAFFAGFGASFLAPSSTTMSLLAVQSVQAGHLTLRPALAMMLGADIGLTAMVLLIAFRIDQFWAVLALIGVLLFQFGRPTRARAFGQVLLGLGFILLGIQVIKARAVMLGTAPDSDVVKLMEMAADHPFVLALLAAVLAVLLQSSTATIALVIGLASAQTNELDVLSVALPVVAGANVGIGVTTLLFSWAQTESKQVAVGNLIAKLITAAMYLLVIQTIAKGLDRLPGEATNHIAYAHCGFNVAMALIFMPALGPLARAVSTLVAVPAESQRELYGPRYISASPTEGWALALGQSTREIMRVAEIVRGMLQDLWQAVRTDDEALALSVSRRDDQVDLLDGEIKQYLARLSRLEGGQDESTEQMRQLGYLNELENIGDIVDKNLSELAIKKIRKRIQFSEQGWSELQNFYQRVAENMLIAETAFNRRDPELAKQLIRHKQRIDQDERDLRDRHFARLNAGLAQTHESSAIHLDILTHLKRVNSCVTHVAYAIADDKRGESRESAPS